MKSFTTKNSHYWSNFRLNYHISINGMLYFVPYEYIKSKMDIGATKATVKIFTTNCITSNSHLHGRKGGIALSRSIC